MDLKLTGKVALVTGASIGIGHRIAEALAEEGCRLAILARRTALLDALADRIAATGAERPLVLTQDILADDAAARTREAVMARFGRLDILVNNAGASKPLDGLGSAAEWELSMKLNFGAGREMAHAFVPVMRAQKYGRIINITGGDEPTGMNPANPPNGAAHIWAKALSRVTGRDGITVNCIPPGRIHSEQIDQRLLPTEAAQRAWVEQNCPAGYIGDPDDLAALVVFLASPRARYITGQVIHVDGGARHYSH